MMRLNLCKSCEALCCRYGKASILVSSKEKARLEKLGASFDEEGMEPELDGCCFFLKDNRCSIYKQRPEGCKNFDCRDVYPNKTFFAQDFHEELSKLMGLK
jgi:Fe-S-cluster containining protein